MPARYAPTDREIWLLALWSGLVMALGEATIFFVWQLVGTARSVSADIIWAAAIVDTFVCVATAALLVVVSRALPALRPHVPLALGFLVFLNWTAIVLYERVHVGIYPLVAAGLAKVTYDLTETRPGRGMRVVAKTLPVLAAVTTLIAVSVPVGRRVIESRQIAALGPAPARAPNVLVLLMDAFRADHSSAYGYSRPTTPRIDAFAEGGTLFERAYSTSSYTLASHASLLTGLLPHEHGAEWDDAMEYWRCDCPILGEVLQDRGYATAGLSSNPYWFTREYGFARGFHRFEDFFNNPADAVFRTTFGRAVEKFVLPRVGYLDVPGRKRADSVNRRLLRWLDSVDGRPFFAFVNYFDVHDPYMPPEPYRSRYAGKPVGGTINWRITGMDPRLEPAVIQDEMDAYDGAISYLDGQIGALLDSLEARGVLENTFVVITSDHGEEFGEHGLLLHGHGLHVQSVHVPLILRGPGVPAGLRVSDPVSNAALPSTVMALTGLESSFPLAPLVGPAPAEPPVTELVKKPWGSDRFPAFHGAMQAVVDGPWHYIRHDVFGVELYDLASDPAEQHDLAADPAHAELLDRLDRSLEAAWKRPPRTTP